MAEEFDWESFLNGHPIFSNPDSFISGDPPVLSLRSVREKKNAEDAGTLRRQLMCMKESDLIVAVASEIRVACLSDAKLSGGSQKLYKVLHTPHIDFEIHQICLNPNKKLLAVAGTYQVAVVVLPRGSKLGTARIDCKSLQIGSGYHVNSASPVVKIDWHPWGEAGSTLLVMTMDGKLREYDVSLDPDEPRNTLNFSSEKRKGAFGAADDAEREVASFTFGKGKADWGPLTLYAVMKSGQVYAICPYLPENASVPSSYLRALECFVSAKEMFVAENNGELDESFSALYDYQRKYVNSLVKQLPSETPFASAFQSVSIHVPKAFPAQPSRQGPFSLQPAPPELENSPGGDATDVAYVTLGSVFTDADEREDTETSSLASEKLGALLVAYQDGKVDVYLDLEKVEARWDAKITKSLSNPKPSLTSYETIDLAIVSTLASGLDNRDTEALELIAGNHVSFYLDPIYDDTIYAYHAFGVHVLNLNAIFQSLATALKEDDENNLQNTLRDPSNCTVRTILSTHSIGRQLSCPVTAVAIPSDVYLTYSIFILTSSIRVVTFSLNLRTESIDETELADNSQDARIFPVLPVPSEPSAYESLLKPEPFIIPPVLKDPILPTTETLPLPKSFKVKEEVRLTPDTLRYLASAAEKITSEMHQVILACNVMLTRLETQAAEYRRLQEEAVRVIEQTQNLLGPRKTQIQQRLKAVQDEQTKLLARVDRLLRALIRSSSPELNEHETRWFEELQRMKAEVLGAWRHDPDSLKMRIRQLQAEFDRLMPALKKLSQKEAEHKAYLEENSAGAGHSFVKAYEALSRKESKKLEDAIVQVTKLIEKLEISSLKTTVTQ